ncbi:MAG: DEAD/DEAH box helicase [Candidatus Micrarchaeota archaeon]
MEFNPRLASLIAERFSEFTEIQENAMPVVASGANALIIAPTGFGKTEAALLPILDKMCVEKDARGVSILYITPLRALNRDMLRRITWWCEKLGISHGVRHGDTAQGERARQAARPPQLLITTPETLQAILPARKIGDALRNVKYVVIDETHELCEDERGAQLSIGLERLRERCGREFQRIGLSATAGSPEIIAKFLCGNRACEIIQTNVARELSLRVECPRPTKKDEELSEKLFLDASAVARLRMMDELIAKHRATLAFVNTRQVAETLASRLLKLESSIGVHHGSLAREVRIATEEKFKRGDVRGLIATSSLELGIDIGDVDLAIQYMSPRQVGRLVQRVGRSGHAVERIPRGVIITSDADDVLEAIVIAARAREGKLEQTRVHQNALDVLAHQLAGLAMDSGSVKLGDAHEIITRAFPFHTLAREQIVSVAKQLHSERNLWFNAESETLAKSENTRDYYYSNLSTIPSERKFFVRNAVTNSNVSLLDEAFVASYVEPHSVFITKGVPWKVLDIGENEIIVEPSEDLTAAVPDWVGEEIPVPYEVAQDVGKLRREIKNKKIDEIAREYDASHEAVEKAKQILEKQRVLPDDKNIFIESCEDVVVIHICGGSLANNTLGRALSFLLASRFGQSARAEIDPYRIILQLPHTVRAEEMKKLLLTLKPESVRALLQQSTASSSLFKYRFLHVARLFGLISRNVKLTINIKRVIERMRGSPIYEETMREIMHDYVDVEKCEEILRGIARGEIGVHSADVDEPTPLGRIGLTKISGASELIAPIEPRSEILKAFKNQILSKRAKFICTYCGKIMYRVLRELQNRIKCENCGSSMVALVERTGKEKRAGAKERQGEKGNEEKARGKEKARPRKEFLRSASLVDAYGKRAVFAMSVYGVGTETAARVLARVHPSEELLFVDLLEAQKQFIRTRRYWKA